MERSSMVVVFCLLLTRAASSRASSSSNISGQTTTSFLRSKPEGRPEDPGLDPLIGQGVRAMSGLDPIDAQKVLSNMPAFIIPRGGEYFFSPSIKGLRSTIAST